MADAAPPPKPVRVKVYGLFPLTRRRYLWQAAFGVAGLVVLLTIWLVVWPEMQARLAHLKLNPWMNVICAIVAQTPWIVLGVAVFKGVEAIVVLRQFAAKEREQRPAPS